MRGRSGLQNIRRACRARGNGDGAATRRAHRRLGLRRADNLRLRLLSPRAIPRNLRASPYPQPTAGRRLRPPPEALQVQGSQPRLARGRAQLNLPCLSSLVRLSLIVAGNWGMLRLGE